MTARASKRHHILAAVTLVAMLACAIATLRPNAAAAAPTGSASKPASAPPAAAPTLDGLLGELRRSPGISAEFTETKHIALLRAPLVNTGSVYFMPPALLSRRVESPRKSVLVLDGEQLTFSDSDGVHRLDLGANPLAGALVSSLVSVLAGDRPALERRFEMTFDVSAAPRWALRLRPRDAAVRRVLQALDLAGSGIVLSEMTLRDGNGDVTVSTFEHVVQSRRFKADERARFFGINPSP